MAVLIPVAIAAYCLVRWLINQARRRGDDEYYDQGQGYDMKDQR